MHYNYISMIFFQNAHLSCWLFLNNNEKLIYQDPLGQSNTLKGDRTLELLLLTYSEGRDMLTVWAIGSWLSEWSEAGLWPAETTVRKKVF